MMFARRSHGLIPSLLSSTRRGRRPSRARRPGLGPPERCEDRVLLSISLISVDAAGTAPGDDASDFTGAAFGEATDSGPSAAPSGDLSADGTELAFTSEATDLVPGLSDTNHASDIFVRDTATGQTILVSATPSGQPGNGASFDPVISPDGRYVAFLSQATDLSTVSPPETALTDPSAGYLYLRDLQTGTTTLLDQTPSGQASDGYSTGTFVFSPDSRSLAFVDTSDDLTGAAVDPSSASSAGLFGPSIQPSYVYVRDLPGQVTSLVSVSTDGMASGSDSFDGAVPTDLVFSPDGRSLVFSSTATDLTANPPDPSTDATWGDPFGSTNLFVRDLDTGTTTLLSATAAGQLASGDSTDPVFSPDGQSVAFLSTATDLTTNPPGAAASDFVTNVFVRDLAAGTTRLVSATTGGQLSDGTAASPVFSPDGDSLAFISSATDLTENSIDPTPPSGQFTPPDQPSLPGSGDNVFLNDLATGQTTAVSLTPKGQLSSGAADSLVFSPDGRYLAFTSSATDLTANPLEKSVPPGPGSSASGSSASYSGSGSGGPSGGPPVDNVFVRDLTAGTTSLASVTTGGLLPVATSGGMMFSPDSQLLYFASGALDLTSNPPAAGSNGPEFYDTSANNLFVRDLAAGTTSLISATTDGHLSGATQTSAVLAPDGQTIYFASDAANLTAADPGGSTNLYAASAPFTAPDQFQFQSWATTAKESDGQAVVTVVRTGPATDAASVDYAVQDGTATSGTDYAATSGTLDFAPGVTSQTFTVPLIAGDQFTGTRSAQLVLSNPQGAGLGYPSAALDLAGNPPSVPVPPVSPPSIPTTTPSTPPANPPARPATPSNPTATARTPATPAAPVVAEPGPTVVGVSSAKEGRGVTGLVITFDRPLDPAAAQDAANYQVSVPERSMHGRHEHRSAARSSRPAEVLGATYDAATRQVTLVLKSKGLRRGPAQLEINGTAGGVASSDGVPLNSPDRTKPGQDYLGVVDLVVPHPRGRGAHA